jgi:poly(hydroxyalkanoate) depolymerase family esterase
MPMRLEQLGIPRVGVSRQFPGSRLRPRADFGSNPGALQMFSYRPPGLPAGAPLVVILHGCGQSAMAYDQGAGWSTLADRFQFALLAPEQTKGNNFNRCFNWFLPGDTTRGNGEAESIRQMILAATADFSSDPGRVYITGLSAGGAMTSVMLATYPELFAAGAIIAGLPYGAAANVQEALAAMRAPLPRQAREWGEAVRGASAHRGRWPRISVWHGDADQTVAPSNMEAIIEQWRNVHGLAEPPLRDERQNHLRRTWHGQAPAPVIEAVSIAGLGHGTPIKCGPGLDSCGEPGPFILEAGISSSARIAEFFGLCKPIPVAAAEAAVRTTPGFAGAQAQAAGRLQAAVVKALKAAGLMAKS